MNLPNRITLVRLILIPFIVFFYLMSPIIYSGKIIAGVIFAIACLTDFLDGFLARKLNLVTTLGKFLDSIADKVLVLIGFVLIVSDNTILAPFGVISLSVILVRELSISALRQLAASKNVILAADKWGKVKANFQFFCVLFYIIFSFFIDNPATISTGLYNAFNIVCLVLLGLAVVSTVVSGVHYLVQNRKVFKD